MATGCVHSLEDYKDQPHGLDPVEVNRLTMLCLSESGGEEDSITLEKLWHLALRQYHTYQLPPDDVRGQLSLWMAEKCPLWSGSEIVRALAVAGMYGLEKGLFSNLLERCPADRKRQFDKKLARSKGNLVDPYYDLRKNE